MTTPPADEYTVCVHCRYIIRQDDAGDWRHNGTGRRLCATATTAATPLYRTRAG